MTKLLKAVGAAGLFVASTVFAQAQSVKTETLAPGKGVSFYLGSKHGITLFVPGDGACDLTVNIAENPDQEGMNASTASRIQMSVVPGKPARIVTAEGSQLVFICNPDVQSMKLEMPADFKYAPKG